MGVPGRPPARRRQRITLLPPPSLNDLYTPALVDGHARIFLTQAARDWKKGQAQMLAFLRPVPAPKDVKVDIVWMMTAEDNGDMDNRLKLLLDAMQGHGYDNDSQIAELVVSRVRSQRWARMEITIDDISQRESRSRIAEEGEEDLT